MNVDDIKNVPDSVNYLKDIFERQTELIEKYHPIEHQVIGIERLNILLSDPFNIDDPVVQLKIKEHLWRVVEEVAESFEVVHNNEDNFTHQVEELSDALHFMVETMIMVKLSYSDVESLESLLDYYNYTDGEDQNNNLDSDHFMYNQVFYHIGIVGNCLKNKPWKRTQMRTDKIKFYSSIKDAYNNLIYLFIHLGLEPKDIYEIYFKKSEINKFRQRSNY